MKLDIYSQKEIAESGGTGILKFHATWCLPCRALQTTLKSPELADLDIKVWEIDTDENPELAEAFNIRGVPTMIRIAGGVEQDRISGNIGAARFREWVSQSAQ